MNTQDPRSELLECSDILVAAAEWQQASKDWDDQLRALTIEYADAEEHPLVTSEEGVEYYPDGDELLAHPAHQRWLELMEKLKEHGRPPLPSFDQEEFSTALWQLPELAIGLFMVFTEMLDEQNGRGEREQVAEIIRPQLIVPGR